MDEEKIPKCPKCNSDRVAKIIYGRFVPMKWVKLRKEKKISRIVHLDIAKPKGSPDWECERCKHKFTHLVQNNTYKVSIKKCTACGGKNLTKTNDYETTCKECGMVFHQECADCGRSNFFKDKEGRTICKDCGLVVLTEEDKKPMKIGKKFLKHYRMIKKEKT